MQFTIDLAIQFFPTLGEHNGLFCNQSEKQKCHQLHDYKITLMYILYSLARNFKLGKVDVSMNVRYMNVQSSFFQ